MKTKHYYLYFITKLFTNNNNNNISLYNFKIDDLRKVVVPVTSSKKSEASCYVYWRYTGKEYTQDTFSIRTGGSTLADIIFTTDRRLKIDERNITTIYLSVMFKKMWIFIFLCVIFVLTSKIVFCQPRVLWDYSYESSMPGEWFPMD